jgi:hypothetical protein
MLKQNIIWDKTPPGQNKHLGHNITWDRKSPETKSHLDRRSSETKHNLTKYHQGQNIILETIHHPWDKTSPRTKHHHMF